MAARAHPKAGIALPLVLTVVAILTLTFAVCLNGLSDLRTETRLALDRMEFERAAMSAEARMAYMMVTEPFGAASLNIGAQRSSPAPAGGRGGRGGGTPTPVVVIAPDATIMLDGRPYAWREGAETKAYLAQAQDEAGLINLYDASAEQLTRLFSRLGLELEDAENLANEVVTYNFDPNAHQPMRKPSELFRLESARDLISERAWTELQKHIVAYPDMRAININTAPAQELSILFDLSDDEAASIVEMREGQVLASTNDVGIAAPSNRNYAFSGGRLRFTFIDPASGLTYRSSLVLTPNSGERPIWVENPQTLKAPPPTEVVLDDLEAFPEVPDPAA